MLNDPVYGKLSRTQKTLVDALPRDVDVSIVDIYNAVYPDDRNFSVREMQQRIGAHISRINRKFVFDRIKPGRTKQTYRLTSRL